MTQSKQWPLIDVIVPVHGAGPVFRRCAASLIAHADAFGGGAFGADVSGVDEPGVDEPGVDVSGVDGSSGVDGAFAVDGSGAAARSVRDRRDRLVIVLDGPPDAGTLEAVEDLRAAARREVGGFELEVIEHETPLGFVLSANHALRGSDRDAVFLNSDTQVTAGWLGRLRAAAYSDSKIATVTPFSNNATICSLPRFLDENALPASHTVDSFGALVTRVSRREYPRLPTGVGFCLYVKRSVLDELGLFDEVFGLGYGEEVDFCLRAASRGYVHVLDDATFIFHEGSRSFGRRREERMRRGERLVLSRYPDYLRNVAEFIKNDPIASARARVLDELRRTDANAMEAARFPDRHGVSITPSLDASLTKHNDMLAPIEVEPSFDARDGARGGWPERVLHIMPGWPPWTSGDAAMAARALVRDQSARREVFVYAGMVDPDRADGAALEYLDGGVRVRLIVAASSGERARRTVLSRIGVRPDAVGEDFARFVAEVRPQIVHVHDLGEESLDLSGAGRVRAIRGALKSVDALVMGSQTIADRYAAARLLPRSVRVAVVPFPLEGNQNAYEEIERVYAQVENSRPWS